MRFVAAAVLLLCLAGPSLAEPTDVVATQSKPFAAAPTTAFRVIVGDDGRVSLDVLVSQGSLRSISITGPGSCGGPQAAAAGSSLHFDCGWVPPGEAFLGLEVDGLFATGTLTVQGATFPV